MEGAECCACGSDKPYEQCCGCETVDPVQQAMMMWHKSFFVALHEAQTERIRKRIETTYGPTMDKAADAVFEAIGKVWSSMLTQSEAKKELTSKLQKIFSETGRK
jgi:hypothetical protein